VSVVAHGNRASTDQGTLDNEASAVGKQPLVVAELSTPMASDERHPRIRQRNAVQTDVGVIRDHNEDTAYADPEGDFFIVADGMGGHAAGEVASKMAVDAVMAALQGTREEIAQFARAPSDQGRRALVSSLENAVRQAHQSVYQRGAAETDKQGMGTTLDVVLIAGSEAFVAHVGDSRTYLVRERRAAQITTDHTVAEVLVIEGKLSIEEAQISPLRTILVNAIGVAPDVGVEMAHVRLRTGDRLLLCSDGLHDYFPLEQEVSDYVSENDPDQALNKMITVAKNRGGHDNITGIVLEVLETPDAVSADDDMEPRRVGYEDTGNMPAVTDAEAVPDEIARDDTAPVSDKRASEAARAAAPANGTGSAAETPPAADAASADGKAQAKKSPDKKPDEKASDKAPAKEAKEAPAPDPAADSSSDDLPTEELESPDAASKKRRRGKGKADSKARGTRQEIESADTDELPAEPGEEGSRSRSD
jgi:serine/threonine protein phosphatase PrpC